ncbi:TetR/AcrR family transcriptional regulator [Desmospora activa]|uniref:TetR family transcriptional regulator n=1 Tax=Desmospora activa DSM 45169 TaxID=1121389 RepID=A0A2T4Z779_9BACL|nr:TetR/AcrR family transcriptional regulator [Desmospora activa]PTM57746.1 TetR family transcriptional regulator [Desmospora activa DSM 45169]
MDAIKTRDKILFAAIDLFAEKGFRAVTTIEIAKRASVSEMTVFRHFGTKKNILDYAIDKFSHDVPMQKIFQEQITWDLEKDLLMFSQECQKLMKKNKKAFRIIIQEIRHFPDLEDKMICKNPQKLRRLLVDYFTRMQEMGKMIQTAPEVPAMAVVSLCVVGTFDVEMLFTDVTADHFITDNIKIFARGLTP